MADEGSIFEDGENLQAAIGKALQEKKALLCFVSDDGDECTQWEAALLDDAVHDNLRSSTVVLRLMAGSEQVGYLNAVCPIQNVPSVVVILNAQVIANYQYGPNTFDQFLHYLATKYASDRGAGSASSKPPSKPLLEGFIKLPSSEGRMRLPNNAYDHFKLLTQKYLDSGVSGKGLLMIQLKLLNSTNNETVTEAVKQIQAQFATVTEPTLSDEAINRLLNLPASSIQSPSTISNNTTPQASASMPNDSRSSQNPTRPPPSSASSNSPRHMTRNSPAASSSSTAAATAGAGQLAEYTASQKAAEAERARIKSQIEADKRTRREADRKAREEAEALRRKAELQELRKANSTTSNPKSTDVRIQVRLFDGGIIRSAFPAEASIGNDVRKWIDDEVAKKAIAGGGQAGQPYDLKLILAPLPNRTIEAGEEDTALSDIEGLKGSATLVMVPVKGYVESYTAGGSGVVGTAVGAAQSVVGTGIGLVGSAAGMVFGGLGRLIGGGSTGPGQEAGQQTQQLGQQGDNVGTTRGANVRVRTLADQRRVEEEEARRKGTQLYNGMGLNVQPRRDEDKDEDRKK